MNNPPTPSESRQTPVPWAVEPHPADHSILIYGPLPEQRLIAELAPTTRLGGMECDANAAFIVEACNSHASHLARMNSRARPRT